jgi:hypothetical protein
MLFREIFAVYCENHMEHTYALCGQNAEFQYVKAGGTDSITQPQTELNLGQALAHEA